MALHLCTQDLLPGSTAKQISQEKIYAIIPNDADDVDAQAQTFKMWVDMQCDGGNQGSTVRITLYSSVDKLKWTQVGQSAAYAGDGDVNNLEIVSVGDLFPYLKVHLAINADTLPTYTTRCHLTSTGRFSLKLVS